MDDVALSASLRSTRSLFCGVYSIDCFVQWGSTMTKMTMAAKSSTSHNQSSDRPFPPTMRSARNTPSKLRARVLQNALFFVFFSEEKLCMQHVCAPPKFSLRYTPMAGWCRRSFSTTAVVGRTATFYVACPSFRHSR